MCSVYFYPENHGLELVAMIDYSSGDYCFDYRVIWKHKETGALYTARDSGCSCPGPFEDYSKIEDLEDFGSGEWIIAEVKAQAMWGRYKGDSPAGFIKKVRALACEDRRRAREETR